MALGQDLRIALEGTKLSFEELRAFEAGLGLLTDEEQEEFLRIVKDDPELVYPLYINFKAKLRAAQEGEDEWQAVVEREIAELEEFMKRRRVGNEVA
jgi:hypothetical protein